MKATFSGEKIKALPKFIFSLSADLDPALGEEIGTNVYYIYL